MTRYLLHFLSAHGLSSLILAGFSVHHSFMCARLRSSIPPPPDPGYYSRKYKNSFFFLALEAKRHEAEIVQKLTSLRYIRRRKTRAVCVILSQDSFALCWSSACAYQQHPSMARRHSSAALLLGASTLISHLEMNIGRWSSRLTHLLRWTLGIPLLFAPLLCTASLLKSMIHSDVLSR